jgi:SAM-dependent methyltransferase
MCAAEFDDRSYDAIYQEFDSPSMQKVRSEAYGKDKDIGQHSWVSAEELEEDIPRLKLTRAGRFLDLGCGPCGPLVFTLDRVACHAGGVDLSAQALAAGRARAAALGLEESITLRQADLNGPIPFETGTFNAVLSLDVVLHLRDRAAVFQEVARVLTPGGRFLFTDAGVMTGPVSAEEIGLRSLHGHTQFVPPGCNERLLEAAGFRLIECIDRTAGLLNNASGRLKARLNHRVGLEQHEGAAYFARQQQYLETVVRLAQKGAMARMMYLAESPAP